MSLPSTSPSSATARCAASSRPDERALGLDDVVTFAGEQEGPVIVEAMRDADVFAITPFVTADGDRDGVPNVIVEALASGLPVVSTDVGGIAEAVEHGHNGLLAAARDVPAVADHLQSLLRNPSRRRMMGTRARETAERGFDVDRAAKQLAHVFGVAEVGS